MNHISILEIKNELKKLWPESTWTPPQKPEFGILSTNYAFIYAGKNKLKPPQASSILAAQLELFVSEKKLPLTIKVVGPYINLSYKNKYLETLLSAGGNTEELFQLPQNQTNFLLEFLGLNVAKPMHAGHLRNANIGESLRRILKLKYPGLISNNYWGDWGLQFAKMLWGWQRLEELEELEVEINKQKVKTSLSFYRQDPIRALIRVYVWSNNQENSQDYPNWEAEVKEIALSLESGDREKLNICNKFKQDSKKELQRVLDKLGVEEIDYNYGESHYVQPAKKLASQLDELNLWKKEGKARFVDFDELLENWGQESSDRKNNENISGNIPAGVKKIAKSLGRCYFISSNGYTSYAMRDVAARLEWAKEEHLNAEKMVTVTASEQRHHFHQVFTYLSYLLTRPEFTKTLSRNQQKISFENLKHVAYGFLTLPDGKMSTRKGNIVTAEDIINKIEASATNTQEKEKVAMAALKWYDLSRDSEFDIVLNMDEILSFEGNTGMYQLYTVARLKSILRKNENATIAPMDNDEVLTNDELLILQEVQSLPMVLEKITATYKPYYLCQLLYSITTKINSWYVKTNVSQEKDLTRKAKLLMFCDYLQKFLSQALHLLAIEVVEEV